jgi:hypothetical protein
MSAILQLKGRYFGPGIVLAAAAAVEATGPVWVQIAQGGEFKGHPKFALIKFDAELFGQVVANFRAHPAYLAGPTGIGAQPVVPYDYEHASEMNPTSGSIPQGGAPAPGWILEIEVRMSAEGVPQLWALTDWGDQAREQIRAKEYRWTSVAIWPSAKDKVSGKDIGPVLTSVALTNKPFVEGMAPLTARVEVWGKAESAEELVVGLRDVLELPPDAEAAIVSSGLDELVAMYRDNRTVPGYPEGVGCLLNQVRRLLGLRALAMADEILAAAGQALGAASASKPTLPVPPAQSPEGASQMSDKLRQNLIALFDVRDNDDAILAAATKSAGALATLDALMKQFKVSSPAELATAATAAQEEAGKVAQFATKLTEALAAMETQDEATAKEETDQIAASLGIAADGKGKALRTMMLTQRIDAGRAALGLGRDAQGKTVLLATGSDPSRLEAFRKEFPLPTPEEASKLLLKTPLVASPTTQLGGSHTALPTIGAAPAPGASSGVPEHIAALSTYPGDNNVQRAIALLSDKSPGFAKLDWGKQNFLAGRYLETGKAA